MKHKEYQQKRASLDDAYLFGEITLSDYARESQNLDTKYYQIKNDNKIIDALEIIRNHEIGDFENVIDDEPTDEEMMSSFGTKWHDGL